MNIYLDCAAATPMHPEVKQSMVKYFDEEFYNPSSMYLVAQGVKNDIHTARRTVAHWMGAKPAEIVFTAGATESDNLAIHGVMEKFPQSNIIISAIEHEAVIEAAANYDYKVAPVQSSGFLNIEKLAELIDDKTALVSVIYANNEIGTIQSLAKISALIEGVRTDRKKREVTQPIYFHTDAVQATNYLDIHASKLGIDLMTLSGAKIYGPKQTGCLYVKGDVELEPLIYGGGQERSLRGGTENVSGIIGFAKAVELAQTNRNEESKRVGELRDQLISTILEGIDGAEVAGTMKKRLPNNINISFPGVDGERLVMELDEKGIMVATGAACSEADDSPSRVLKALGQSDAKAKSSLRISLGLHTDTEDVERAGKTIVDAVRSLQAE